MVRKLIGILILLLLPFIWVAMVLWGADISFDELLEDWKRHNKSEKPWIVLQ
jgi:membrane glycosyltransferase